MRNQRDIREDDSDENIVNQRRLVAASSRDQQAVSRTKQSDKRKKVKEGMQFEHEGMRVSSVMPVTSDAAYALFRN